MLSLFEANIAQEQAIMGMSLMVGVVATVTTWLMVRINHTSAPASVSIDAAEQVALGIDADGRALMPESSPHFPVFVSDPAGTGEPCVGWVDEGPKDHVSMAVSGALDRGTMLQVRPCDQPVTTPWVRLQVKKCKKAKRWWKVDCQVVIQPQKTEE